MLILPYNLLMKFIERFHRSGQKPPEYTPAEEQDIKTLFTLSFQYSQGSDALQWEMFRWLRINGSFPYKITQSPPPSILDLRAPTYHMDTGTLIQSRLDVVNGIWKRMYGAANEKTDDLPTDKLIEKISEEMLQRDLLFQRSPRPGRSLFYSGVPDTAQDPHKSFFRKHVVLGAPTGHRGFDAMFDEVRGIVKAKSDEPSSYLILNLQILAALWNLNHVQSEYGFFGEEFSQPQEALREEPDGKRALQTIL